MLSQGLDRINHYMLDIALELELQVLPRQLVFHHILSKDWVARTQMPLMYINVYIRQSDTSLANIAAVLASIS